MSGLPPVWQTPAKSRRHRTRSHADASRLTLDNAKLERTVADLELALAAKDELTQAQAATIKLFVEEIETARDLVCLARSLVGIDQDDDDADIKRDAVIRLMAIALTPLRADDSEEGR